MNYRPVKCSDRLPEEDGWYTVWLYGENATIEIYPLEKSNKHCIKEWENEVEKWLEPYELPTEEEIEEIYNSVPIPDYWDGNIIETRAFNEGVMEGIKAAITNLLKGER